MQPGWLVLIFFGYCLLLFMIIFFFTISLGYRIYRDRQSGLVGRDGAEGRLGEDWAAVRQNRPRLVVCLTNWSLDFVRL